MHFHTYRRYITPLNTEDGSGIVSCSSQPEQSSICRILEESIPCCLLDISYDEIQISTDICMHMQTHSHTHFRSCHIPSSSCLCFAEGLYWESTQEPQHSHQFWLHCVRTRCTLSSTPGWICEVITEFWIYYKSVLLSQINRRITCSMALTLLLMPKGKLSGWFV